jgi:hypothetical protein
VGENTADLIATLRVDAGLLRDPLAMPLLGSLVVRAVGEGEAHGLLWRPSGYGSVGGITVSDAWSFMAGEGWPFEADWLRFCAPNRDCEVPIRVAMSHKQLASEARVTASLDNRTAPPIPDEFSFTIELTATLEAFDGRSLPTDGLTLTTSP